MGCGCVSQQQASLPSGPRPFLATSDAEFLRTLSAEELKDKKRLLAYYHMLDEGQFEVTNAFKQHVREKGVPDRYRWQAWRALTGWSSLYKPGAYERLARKEPDQKVVEAVAKDLNRTFPKLEEFDEEKIRHLGSVVRAYACLVPQVGYCQGMNFIAGFLLLACSPSHHEDAFFMFVQIMVKYRANLLFCDGLPLLKLLTFQFKMLLPVLNPEVAHHFTLQNITPELYLTKWILTVFTQPLAFESAARVWDLIVCDGIEALVLLCLANVQLLTARLLLQDTEGILELLSLRKDMTPPTGGEIVQAALNLKLPQRGDKIAASLSKFRDTWAQECGEEAAELERAECLICRTDLIEGRLRPSLTQAAEATPTSRQPIPFPDSAALPPSAAEVQTAGASSTPGPSSPVGALPSRCYSAGPGGELESPSVSAGAQANSHAATSAPAPVSGQDAGATYTVAAEAKVDLVHSSTSDCITRWETSDCISKAASEAALNRSSRSLPLPQQSSDQTVRPELHLSLSPRPLAATAPICPTTAGHEFEGDSQSTSCELREVDAAEESTPLAPPASPASPGSAQCPSTPTGAMTQRANDHGLDAQECGSPVSTATAPAALGEHWQSSEFGSSQPLALETSHASTLPPLSLAAAVSKRESGTLGVSEGHSRSPNTSPWMSPVCCRQSPTAVTELSDSQTPMASL